jgi:hypothetical protein
MARRVAIFENLRAGLFARKAVHTVILDQQMEKVVKGSYNEEIDQFINEPNDDVPENDEMMFDKFLAERLTLVSDTVELEQNRLKMPDDQKMKIEERVAMDESEYFTCQMDLDIATFTKNQSEFVELKKDLDTKEQAYKNTLDTNVKEATKGFLDRHVPLLPFRADDEALTANLKKHIDDRVDEVAAAAGCLSENVLRCALCDVHTS